MNSALLQVSLVVYVLGYLWLQRTKWYLISYLWGAAGFTLLLIYFSWLNGWNVQLAQLEAVHVRSLMNALGFNLVLVGETTLLVPDAEGWAGLNIGVECSTLMEISVLTGLLAFYPKLPLTWRVKYIVIGVVVAYLLNLLRMIVLVVLITIWGRGIVVFAHTFLIRFLYFFGVVILYWYLLTKPTLALVRRSIEVTGEGVD